MPLPIGQTEAERELQAYDDELAIIDHVARLTAIAGRERALEVLANALQALSDMHLPRNAERSG